MAWIRFELERRDGGKIIGAEPNEKVCWPKGTSILESAVIEVKSLVVDRAERGELAGTATQLGSYHPHLESKISGAPAGGPRW